MFSGFDSNDPAFLLSRNQFKEHYRCFPINTHKGSGRGSLEYGGKVLLPPSALDRLSRLNIMYPMLFELSNSSKNIKTHVGVLEFTSEEGRIYIPQWIMKLLKLSQNDIVAIMNVNLLTGTFVKIQPQSTDFLNITDPKAVLENALRSFSTLTQGDIIPIDYNSKIYEFLVMETKPDTQISITETDLQVDFAPPLGYEEPKWRPVAEKSMAGSIEKTITPILSSRSSFTGFGRKLNGRLVKDDEINISDSGSVNNLTSPLGTPPAVLDLPPGKIFFGSQPKTISVNNTMVQTAESSAKNSSYKTETGFVPFSGAGRSLK